MNIKKTLEIIYSKNYSIQKNVPKLEKFGVDSDSVFDLGEFDHIKSETVYDSHDSFSRRDDLVK